MKYKAIIFDCDGTLLNTIGDLTNAVNYALGKIGCALQKESDTVKMVGNGIKMLVKRALSTDHQDKIEEAFGYFNEYYKEHFADVTAPYDGIIDLLKELKNKGYRLCLVSNKNRKYLDLLYDKYFAEFLEFGIGETDGLAPKPAPDMVDLALKKLGLCKADAVYVGDSAVDINTAKNSNLDGIFVSWGFATVADLEENGAKIIINAPKELLSWV